jgi:energy-coupling factor transport system permease protein/energy-coupling factor transport system ATP-binding protein
VSAQVSAPVLGRCDPTVLLSVVVLVPLGLLRVYQPAPLAVVWGAAAVAVVLTAGVSPRRLLLAQLPFASFGLSLVMVNAITRDGAVLAVWGPFEITDVGLRMGLALALRTLLVGVCATGFVAVTDPGRLLVSLQQVGHLPVRMGYALLAAHRLLDDLPAEWTAIRRAHAVRAPLREPSSGSRRLRRAASAPGSATGRRRVSRTPRALARAAFVLLVTSIRRVERVAISLESRGLGALEPASRTAWHPAAVTWRDALVIAVVVGALITTLLAASVATSPGVDQAAPQAASYDRASQAAS